MRTTITTLLIITLSILLQACDLRRIGPPLYETFSAEYLQKHDFSKEVIDAVVELKPIEADMVATLSQLPSVDVKHMLGRNPNLTSQQRDILMNDPNEFVRQGVAMNHSLSPEEVNRALSDSSRFVLGSLAMNPIVSHESLLMLRQKHGIALSSFAQNPNCPPSIVKEIETNGSSLEKRLLEITRQHHGGKPKSE